jgi:hypothetical protein
MAQAPALLSRLVARLNAARSWFSTPAGRRFTAIGSVAMSVAILALLADAVRRIGVQQLIDVLPLSPGFWLLYLAAYFLHPIVDWQIFRHWWDLGWRAIAVFLKRRVMNEAMFSYAGDAYLMAWSATHFKLKFDPDAVAAPKVGRGDGPGAEPIDAPLAAIKDVAITSGLAGNLFTLVMLIFAIVFGREALMNTEIDLEIVRRIIIGFALLLILSFGIVFNRNKLLSLTVRANMRAFWLHLFRVSAMQALLVASWFVALPAVGIGTWLILGALRLVIMRMPVPNKEILFAALAADLTGDASVEVAALMAAQGVLWLACHGLAWLIALAIDKSEPAGQSATSG